MTTASNYDVYILFTLSIQTLSSIGLSQGNLKWNDLLLLQFSNENVFPLKIHKVKRFS